MWRIEFPDLAQLRGFIVAQLAYSESTGFTFGGARPGMQLSAIFGEATTSNLDNPQQQTLKYRALIDHPEQGKRDHHEFTLLFWAFNQAPIKHIKLHFSYFNTGSFADSYVQEIRGLLEDVAEKFGKPDAKSLRRGKEEMSFQRGKAKILLWNNHEGFRIQIR